MSRKRESLIEKSIWTDTYIYSLKCWDIIELLKSKNYNRRKIYIYSHGKYWIAKEVLKLK